MGRRQTPRPGKFGRNTIARSAKAYRPQHYAPAGPQFSRPLTYAREARSLPVRARSSRAVAIALPAEGMERRQHGVHPVIGMFAVGASFWFMAAISLTFGQDFEANYLIAVVLAFTLAFGFLMLLTGSITSFDPRWQLERLHFSRFLGCRAEIATGPIRGRAALIQILALPVSLAFGVTAIGLIWLLIK